MVTRNHNLTTEEIKRLYGALRSELNNLSVQNIRNTAAAAGIDITRITSKSESKGGSGSRAEVMPRIDCLFGELPERDQERTLCILAERLIDESDKLAESVQEILGKHGYQFIDGSFIPIDVLDQREAKFLPSTSATELARATSRLVSGDYSGAITSACGAVDLLMQEIYRNSNLGDPGRASFQAKVNTAAKELQIYEIMKNDFLQAGMPEEDASNIANEIKKTVNHAAHALQMLRRAMGDTHGSKPAIRRTAYDSTKWSAAICGLFKESG